MHENLACRPRYYIGDTLIKVRKYEGVWLPVTWNYAVEFFDLMHGRKMLGTDLFWIIPLIIQFHGFHCAVRALSVIQAIKLAWLLLAKRGNEDIIAFLWRCTQTNISAPVSISTADIGVSRTNEKEERIEIELPRFVPFKKRVPLVQRTIWQPAFKRQTYKVFMCVPAVQWVQTATEEFIKGGERIVKCIKFKPRPNKKRRSLQHCRKESKLSLVMTLWIQKQHVPETKTTDSDFITVALGCSGEKEYKADMIWRAENSASAEEHRRLGGLLEAKLLKCFLPISNIRRWSDPGWRKVSSLHERICVPTSSEFVASILALSSFRFTPAMEATSLMSSSSLHQISIRIKW